MKLQADIGAETLQAAMTRFPDARFLRLAHNIAATHHERFDSSGYPNGLVGDKIPLCGRIVALADVYDALTSRRVYKAAFTDEIARGIIVKESGKHCDPIIAKVFVDCEAKCRAIRPSTPNRRLRKRRGRVCGLIESPPPWLIERRLRGALRDADRQTATLLSASGKHTAARGTY